MGEEGIISDDIDRRQLNFSRHVQRKGARSPTRQAIDLRPQEGNGGEVKRKIDTWELRKP